MTPVLGLLGFGPFQAFGLRCALHEGDTECEPCLWLPLPLPRRYLRTRLPRRREAQKATCQQEANLIYRTGSKGIGMGEDTRNQIIAARRAHVRDCMAKKAASAPG
jgi:hypothetical protein